MRAFLCSIDEFIWDAIDIGWTRPEEAKSIWDKQPSQRQMLIAKHLTLFFVVCLQMSSIEFLTLHCQGGLADIGDHF